MEDLSGEISPTTRQNDNHHLIESVEVALLANDLERASLVIGKLQELSGAHDPTLEKLKQRIEEARKSKRSRESLFSSAERFMEQGDFENAVTRLKEVLEQTPDHEKARAMLQIATREIDRRDEVSRKMDKAHSARCRGDFETARDLCADVLNITPDNMRARKFMADLDGWISNRRKVLILVSQGEKYFHLGEYQQAVKVWESISDIDPSFTEGLELIKKARRILKESSQRNEMESIIRKAQQYLDGGRYQAVIDVLDSCPDFQSFRIEGEILRKKALNGLETAELVEKMTKNILDDIENNRIREAERRFSMLLELDPKSRYIDEIRDRLAGNRGDTT